MLLTPPYQPFTEQLVAALAPEIIFLYHDALHIVVSEQPGKTLAVYKSLVQAATIGRNWQLPPWHLHTIDAVTKGIEAGHIFYSNAFTSAPILYRHSKAYLPVPLHRRLLHSLQQSQRYFATGIQRSLGFAKGAALYHSKGENDMAAFMLHQSIELLLRYLLLAIMNKELKTHSIKEYLQHCRSFAPQLWHYCCVEEANGLQALLLLLDKAYCHARYADSFTISSGKITSGLKLAQDLQQLAGQLIDELLQPMLHPIMDLPSLLPANIITGHVQR